MAKDKNLKNKKKQKFIKRTKSIKEVIQESKTFFKTKTTAQKVTKKIQKKDIPPKKAIAQTKKQTNQKKDKTVQKKNKKVQKKEKKEKKISETKESETNEVKEPEINEVKEPEIKETKDEEKVTDEIQEDKEKPTETIQEVETPYVPERRRNLREEEIETYLHREELREEEHEMDNHRNFKERYLGREGAFGEYKIIIGLFDEFNFEELAGAELKRRGFQYELERNFDTFVKKFNQFDIVWIINSGRTRSQEQADNLNNEIEILFKAKKALFLWSDNDPLFSETNIILKKFFDGMNMQGNYHGNQIVTKGTVQKGQFDGNHSIGYGINNLNEGFTICAPHKTHPDFKHFAYNTNDEPLVSYAEENEHHGRIMLDCGFTKLWKCYGGEAGTAQYISNSNVWLTGIPI